MSPTAMIQLKKLQILTMKCLEKIPRKAGKSMPFSKIGPAKLLVKGLLFNADGNIVE
jgi:hypothetical protein